MSQKPDAFLSYTRFDDRHGRITDFRTWLSDAVREASGEPFDIFQDVDDAKGIALGQRWKDVLDEMLDQARFFIPILTPSFFKSPNCRSELKKFLDLEAKAGRRDLVLPVYWITCPVFEEADLGAEDELAREISERQRWDWRELRFEEMTSPACRRDLHKRALQIEHARVTRFTLVETTAVAIGSDVVVDSATTSVSVSQRPQPSPANPKPAPSLWTPGTIFRSIDQPWCPEMVVIPAGSFLMGSPAGEAQQRDWEGPQHEVTISRPFALGRHAVTFEEYDHFCTATGREKPDDRGWGRGRRPVIHVSWDDASAYCAWLSETTEKNYRLPSEAEWEYACRAGSTSTYAFGATIDETQANFGGHVGRTSEVGAYPANGFGLYDMHGNVWEWVEDSWHGSYAGAPADGSPWTKGNNSARVLRGGAWSDYPRNLRSANRGRNVPDYQYNFIGFRLSRTLTP
jgi:formylglycine-generating enzyme required for sulfatase activity